MKHNRSVVFEKQKSGGSAVNATHEAAKKDAEDRHKIKSFSVSIDAFKKAPKHVSNANAASAMNGCFVRTLLKIRRVSVGVYAGMNAKAAMKLHSRNDCAAANRHIR